MGDKGFLSRTGSSRGYYKQNGELIAKPHPVMKKSYSSNGSANLMTSTQKLSYKDPNMKQALTKYHPDAIRNRLPVTFDNAAKPGVRFCYPRNVHTAE